MKITICASMSFSKEILETKKKLEELGNEVIIPKNTQKFVDGQVSVEDKWEKIEVDPLRVYFKEIKNSDAILVLNYAKKNIEGYVGANTLIEMAFAYVSYKPIYLLNKIPKLDYTDEIECMKPIVINEDFKKII
jgi:nucleoside 2-deoxyribosyltransferase